MPQLDNKQKRSTWRFAMATLVIGIIIGVSTLLVIGYSPALAQAYRLATTHQAERYSELYFDKHRSLPSTAPVGTPRSVAFTIVNHEATTVTYHYVVSMTIAGTVTTLQEGNVQLKDGAAANTSVSFSVPKPDSSAMISVALVGRSEQIVFRSQS